MREYYGEGLNIKNIPGGVGKIELEKCKRYIYTRREG